MMDGQLFFIALAFSAISLTVSLATLYIALRQLKKQALYNNADDSIGLIHDKQAEYIHIDLSADEALYQREQANRRDQWL